MGQAQNTPASSVSVHQIVAEVLRSYESKLMTMKISLDADIESVRASTDKSTVVRATQALIDNAIESMPDGGDLSVTLIDGPHQWELEVADTAGQLTERKQPQNPNASELPVHRLAQETGSEIQTWNCPMGGKAHVLVFPHEHTSPQRRAAS